MASSRTQMMNKETNFNNQQIVSKKHDTAICYIHCYAQLIMYKLQYFKSGDSLCGSDLENKQQVEYINLQQVSSLSDIKKFHLPLSGTYKGDYAILSMQNGDRFYIDKKEHSRISEVLSCT